MLAPCSPSWRKHPGFIRRCNKGHCQVLESVKPQRPLGGKGQAVGQPEEQRVCGEQQTSTITTTDTAGRRQGGS